MPKRKRELRVVWDCYRRGDHINDQELEALIVDTHQALNALLYRKDFGIAVHVLAQDLTSLEGYRNSRIRDRVDAPGPAPVGR